MIVVLVEVKLVSRRICGGEEVGGVGGIVAIGGKPRLRLGKGL